MHAVILMLWLASFASGRFAVVISECGCDTEGQRIHRQRCFLIKHDGTITFEFEFIWKQGAKSLDEVGLAVKI